MKKITIVLMVIFIPLLSACFNENGEQVEIEQEVRQKDIDAFQPDTEEEEVSVIEEEVQEELKEAEVPRYLLQSDHTIKPADDFGNEQVVLLTIDDAPNRYSVEMATLLKEKNINAIFFVNGHFINNEAGREKLKAIYEMGFEIGNHTMYHPNLRGLSEEKQRQEIVELNDLIEEITGERPRFFRAPFGVNTDVSRRVVTEEGMQWMNWTYGYDFEKDYMQKDALAEIMVNTNLLRPGANLLMHDHEWTLEALPLIIEGLVEKGYGFVDPKAIE
ncbi:polysaccharide deacetylase family protein [Anaerobacillus sp. CMMVII]|uniref:polysaccharide deacetylase family protein n=1 Tax=Anaerobacillus sp. CMMVII TaxID=2755588 RepID=UPI0021B78CA9|nr:polysaccharide deacetylase family protein [Anaerobacillus sp. CMMVII]MCT8139090.1 polysaccharide deacetylase family protein [Anaerobacillus sp. CMMVII]